MARNLAIGNEGIRDMAFLPCAGADIQLGDAAYLESNPVRRRPFKHTLCYERPTKTSKAAW
jgi:hypothetical protein